MLLVAVLNLSPSQASNIDDVLGHHTSFLDTCLKDCMLTNPELLKVFSKLMSVCVMFTNCMQVRRGGWLGHPGHCSRQPCPHHLQCWWSPWVFLTSTLLPEHGLP